MKLLLISDHESEYLWDYYQPGCLSGIEMILSCGDLNSKYLSFLVTMTGVPLLYVHGNHDKTYDVHPPEGCDCVEDQLVCVKGLRVLGLGGSYLYNGGPHQYTERQMARRIRRLRFQLWRSGGVDIVLTHSPMEGYGDGEDYAHQGFRCLLDLVDKYRPQYLVHGHVHRNYGVDIPRTLSRGETTIVNAYERYTIEARPGGDRKEPARRRRLVF